MLTRVASSTKRNKITCGIVARVASEFLVMNFQVGHDSACLAFPAIAAQHLVAELFIHLGIKSQARPFRFDATHDAFSAKWFKNVFLSSPGRNLRRRRIDCSRICELPFSRFAPARKSAQIISKQ
jgi:hypothetical protein